MDLAPLKAHIRQVCGLSFDSEKEAVLAGAVQTRQSALKIPSAAEYSKRVVADVQEFQALVNLLTINETYFFRETQHIDLLTRLLLPRLIAVRRSEGRIRILCAGCSTGEEPYSLSIALLETFGVNAPQMFSIVAADIDSEVLARAEKGVYSGLSFRNTPADVVERWFTVCGPSRYRLDDGVRRMVKFQRLNLLEDVYPGELMGQDVILFRNVSIYFDADVRKSVQVKLAKLLNEGGSLIVGLTETLPNDFGILSLTAEHGVFYFVKSEGVAKPTRPTPPRPRVRPSSPPPRIRRTPPDRPPPVPAPPSSENSLPSIDHALSCFREKRYDEALAEVDRLERQAPGDSRHHVLRAHIAFNRKDTAAARAAAEKALKHDEWSLDAFLLLAQIARLGEHRSEAVRRLKQAIYVQPKCWPAHYWLAELYRSEGDRDKAGREYRIVVRQTAGGGESGAGLLVFPLGVSAAEVGALCRHQLRSLGME